MKKRKRPINPGGNKHANEVGKTTRGLTLNESTLTELKASQGGSPRVTRDTPINSGGNKHAYEVGKITTRSPASLDGFRVNLLTFYPPAH